MKNIPSLSDFSQMASAEREALPHDVLLEIQSELETKDAVVKKLNAVFEATLNAKYGDQILSEYVGKDEPYGSQSVMVNGGKLQCDRKKNVKWDNEELAKIEIQLRNDNHIPGEYITIERKISETSYKAWPASLSKFFDSARTVKPGKLSIKLVAEEN